MNNVDWTKVVMTVLGGLILALQGYTSSQVPGLERTLNANHDEITQDANTIKIEQRELSELVEEVKVVQQQQLQYAGDATEQLKKINERLDAIAASHTPAK